MLEVTGKSSGNLNPGDGGREGHIPEILEPGTTQSIDDFDEGVKRSKTHSDSHILLLGKQVHSLAWNS